MSTKRHSGFEAPAIGTLLPKGTTWKKNPDGTFTPIYPKNESAGKDKPKQPAKKK